MINKIGIICDWDDQSFRNFCYIVADIYQVPKIVNIIPDLVDLDMLFIGDYYYHKDIWGQHGFIEYCNDHNIIVVSFTENNNNGYLKRLEQFRHLYHHACNITDHNAIETFLKKDMLI